MLIGLLIMGTAACQVASKSNSQPLGEASSEQNTQQGQEDKKPENDLISENEPEENNMNPDANEGKNTVMATLYFGDSQAMKLVEEKRSVPDTTPETLINELIKGPQDENNIKTIPEGTKLLGIEVKNGIAYVNFSKELKDNHWGGSTGETFTIYSIVSTLVLQPNSGIERVQILVEGEIIETLAGHADISMPIEPDLRMVDMK